MPQSVQELVSPGHDSVEPLVVNQDEAERLRKLAEDLIRMKTQYADSRAAVIAQLLQDRIDAGEAAKKTIAGINEQLTELGYRRPRIAPAAKAPKVSRKRAQPAPKEEK